MSGWCRAASATGATLFTNSTACRKFLAVNFRVKRVPGTPNPCRVQRFSGKAAKAARAPSASSSVDWPWSSSPQEWQTFFSGGSAIGLLGMKLCAALASARVMSVRGVMAAQ